MGEKEEPQSREGTKTAAKEGKIRDVVLLSPFPKDRFCSPGPV
jgi:hypothetical protein